MELNLDFLFEKQAKIIHKEHQDKQFFVDRKISQKKLSKVLGVSLVSVHNWLNGVWVVPPRRQVQLEELKNKILAWEKERGRIFGSK
jgi:hypothetical protein